MVAEFESQLAIQTLLARYCHHCDDGDFSALIRVFSPNGTFEYGGEAVTGREALLEHFTRIQPPDRRGKHLTTNVIATVGADSASVVSDWAFFSLADGVLVPRLAGRYVDQVVRIDGEWLIERRQVQPLKRPPRTS